MEPSYEDQVFAADMAGSLPLYSSQVVEGIQTRAAYAASRNLQNEVRQGVFRRVRRGLWIGFFAVVFVIFWAVMVIASSP